MGKNDKENNILSNVVLKEMSGGWKGEFEFISGR